MKRILNFFLHQGLNEPLAQKFLVRILFFSSVVTLVLTSFQLIKEYTDDYSGIEHRIHEIEETNLETLSRSVWVLNKDQINLQLKGLVRIPDIAYIELTTDVGDVYKQGDPSGVNNPLERIYALKYKNENTRYQLGQLKVIASLDDINANIREKFFIVLVSQATKTFIVSLFILYMFYKLIGQHLKQIVEYAENLNLQSLEKPLVIHRFKNDTEKDEIDKIVNAMNDMRIRIKDEFAKTENLEKQVRHKQKMESLGTLASGIAHDFNNILQGIFNSLFVLGQDPTVNKKSKEYIKTSIQFGERGRDLVKKILLFCRNEESELKSEDINEVFNEAVGMIKSTIPANINLAVNSRELGKIVNCDKTQLNQVIINLAVNAAQAMRDKGNLLELEMEQVTVDKSDVLSDELSPGEYVKITVRDNGAGMNEEVRRRLFEPFFTTKAKGEGTGLGLSVAHGIVERHKGHIEVQSEMGIGTTFLVYLPISGDRGIRQEIHRDLQIVRNEVIMFVDDEKEILDMSVEILNSMGYEVVGFTDPLLAFEEISNNRGYYDIVITDYNMPQMNGIILANNIRSLDVNIPIILATGQIDEHIPEGDLVQAVLMKPYFKDELVEVINKVGDGQPSVISA